MVTAEIFEVVGAVLAFVASTGGIGGAIIARDKTRTMKAFAATVPDVAVLEERSPTEPQPPHPFRDPATNPAPRRSSLRPRRLFHHQYDLMVGRTMFR
jgi:hypothetical protein